MQEGLRLPGLLDDTYAGGQLGEENFHLQTRDRLPDTLVDAHAEGEVSSGFPVDAVVIGVRTPAALVPVRRTGEDGDFESSASNVPARCTSRDVVRKKDWNGDSKRNASSIANLTSRGWSWTRAH